MPRLKVYKPVKPMKSLRKYSIRTKKLVRLICEECSPLGLGWWNTCPHDPAHRLKPVTVRVEQRQIDEATGLVVKTEEKKKVTHYAHVPNFVQVPLTMRINSGFGVEAAKAKGFKEPQDVKPTSATGEFEDYDGYAPMCEYQNCYEPNPKIKARFAGLEENRMIPPDSVYGYFCSELHAKLAKQKDSETLTREVEDQTKRREQLESIALP